MGLTPIEAAAAYLPEFIRDYNQRFARPPRECTSAWRTAPRDLDSILACRYVRVVARDNTVTLPGRWVQLPPRDRGRSWQGRRVEVRELLDGRLHVFYDQQRVAEQAWPLPNPFTLVPRDGAGPARRAALGIDLPESTRIDDRTATKVKPRPKKRGIGHYTNIRHPAPNSPWARTKTLNLPPRPARAERT